MLAWAFWNLGKKPAIMRSSFILQQPQCHHACFACPFSQTSRASSKHLTHARKYRQITSWKDHCHFRCNAVAEPEVEAADTETGTDSLEIEDLNNKDFRAAFDNLLEKTKTRFDVGDKVRGAVERCLSFSGAGKREPTISTRRVL